MDVTIAQQCPPCNQIAGLIVGFLLGMIFFIIISGIQFYLANGIFWIREYRRQYRKEKYRQRELKENYIEPWNNDE